MATSVTLPALGESVTEGTVTRWLKQPGEEVQADEPLLEVSTDKVDTEIPSPTSGTLLEIKVAEDETVEVGTELAVIGDPSEGNGSGKPEQPASQKAAASAGATSTGAASAGAEAQPAQPSADASQPADSSPTAGAATSPAQSGPPAAGGSAGGTPVTLPALGESVTEGTVTRWLKQVGEEVQADEPLLEVSTDKVDTEIPSPASGTLLEIKVAEDETVEVGTELAVIGSADSSDGRPQAPADQAPAQAAEQAETPLEGEARERAAAEAQSAEQAEPTEQAPAEQAPAEQGQPGRPVPAQQAPPARQPAAAGQAPPGAESPSGDGSPYVTPLVRKLAAEHSVDLAGLTGTGVGGRIRKQDVLAAAEQARKTAAQPAPAAAAAPARPSGAAPAASALRGTTEKMSRLRATIARRMVESLQVSAQLTTIVEVDVTAIARLRQRAKAGFEAREGVKLSFLPFFAKAAVEALKAHPNVNATIDTDKGEITYFDAEHLGVADETGADSIAIRSMAYLSLTYDHRLVDGADAARFLATIKQRLEGGQFEGDLGI